MKKAMCLVGVLVVMGLSVPVQAELVNTFDDASYLDSFTFYTLGAFTSGQLGVDSGFAVSPTRSMRMYGTGRDASTEYISNAYCVADWDLGQEYNMYAGGDGEVTAQVLRFAKVGFIDIELIHKTDTTEDVRAYGRHFFDDTRVWNELVVDMDGDETDINMVRFKAWTYQTSSTTSYVHIDDFAFVPEPVTGGLLLVGGGLQVLRRRRSA